MELVKEKEFQIALAEVDEILYFTDENIVSKIPSSFKQFVKENKDKNYISNINPYMSLDDQDLRPETEAIISLIYRSYIADEEEKEKFKKKDQEEFEEIEKQKSIKYNPNDIFKQNKVSDLLKANNETEIKDEQNEQLAITVFEENLFKKILNKIKNIISLITGKK